MGTLIAATVSKINFSWRKIFSNQTIKIPIQQQMIVHECISIEAGGELEIEFCAELAVIP